MINSRDSYRKLFKNSPAPMYIYDDETFEFIEVNDAALRQYGYTREEFLSMSAVELRPAEDVASFRAANIGVPDNYYDFGRWRHLRKNLEPFYVQIYAFSSELEGRKAAIVMAVDIDQKVKVEKQLAEKNAEIAAVLESIADGFYALNSKWEITYFNKTAERVLCCKREDVIGKNIWDYFPRSREGRFYEEYQRAMTEKVAVQFEECYSPLEVWGAIRVYPSQDGISVYFVDITEQKKIQEKIYDNEQNLSAIINTTDDSIWSIDRDFRFISTNAAFRDRLRTKFGMQEGSLVRADFDKEMFKEWAVYYQIAFTGEAFKTVRSFETAKGKAYEEISFNPIRNKNQEVVGISCFARDITAQYLHIQKIETQNALLRKIAWTQSHELRLPVANILGLSKLVDTKNWGDLANQELLQLMIKSVDQLDQVIKKITGYTSDPGSTS
ncbi:MAG: PAS domain S-box protein [Chitinophagaceae bacterium]|nr:PAS domain S-box protein [Chitinophagaceae bacterium]